MTYAPPPTQAAPVNPPGRSIGIAGLVCALIGIVVPGLPIVGLILSIVGKVQSRKAGVANTPATVGLIISIIVIALQIIGLILLIAFSATLVGGVMEMCNELGPGIHEVNGITYTCN